MACNRFSVLSPARKSCVRACQQLNFGKVIALGVVRREPVFNDDTRTLVDLKLDIEDGPRPKLALDDFELPSEWVKLFAKLDAIGDGVIDEVEIRAGLPRKIIYTQPR